MNKYKRSLTNYLKELVVSSPVNRNWQYLGNCFLQPLKKYIRKDDLILVIPFGNLHFLPFPALLLETEPLITTNPVVYCPSATVAHYITENRSQEKQKSISFGIALSKEEESKQLTIEKIKSKQTFEEEARQIARYLDAPHYIGADVTKKFVCTSMNDKDIIHFSCHGIYNPGDPLASGLKLYDGILTAREIMNLNLKATLVTLNACVTGIGFKTEGDELIGLSRAFLSAGVSSLIVTLWYVYSASAKMFMEKFYYNYLKEKHNKAKSLQKTQIDIMDNNEFRKPYYWAPYILIGDWQ